MGTSFELKEELHKMHGDNADGHGADSPYFVDDSGYLCRVKQTKDGTVPARLANFEAWITQETIEDDGAEQKQGYTIEGKVKSRALPAIDVPASAFFSLNWIHKWGNEAILEPGQAIRDYVRHAIQTRSKECKRLHYYTHSGWREIGGAWAYLSDTGAIGNAHAMVRLPKELQRYSLPLIPENETDAAQSALSFLNVAKRDLTLPLFAFAFLAPLTTILEPMPNFSLYLYGESGTFKTTLATLAQSLFGDFTDASKLSNFDDTVRSIEKRAFILKDTLMVLDDYHPSSNRHDAHQKETTAQEVIRKFSNRTGRHRLNSDATDKGAYEPRGMLIITGEELVSLPSTLARVCVLEIAHGDVHIDRLTGLQAKAHLLPHATSSYVHWLKAQIPDIKKTFKSDFMQLRDKAHREGSHRKLPEQVAFLQYGIETALSWLMDIKALSENEARSLSSESWTAFNELTIRHGDRIQREDPVKRFTEILDTLITQGKVRLDDKDNHERLIGGRDADLHGYFDDTYLYLLPGALWNTLQRYCIAEGAHFPYKRYTLFSALKKKGLTDTDRDRTTKTEWIRGKAQKVLKLIEGGMYEKAVRTVSGGQDA